MAKFRKKPVVIEAVQLTKDSYADVMEFVGQKRQAWNGERPTFYIRTLEGVLTVSDGDWVIKGVKGEFYPCTPDIFAATYEPVLSEGGTP